MSKHKSKKRKSRHDDDDTSTSNRPPSSSGYVDTSKPTAVYTPTTGRRYTLSVALPGSIIANAPTHDLKTSLAGRIGRALAVFCVDEVIIFDDGQGNNNSNSSTTSQPTQNSLSGRAEASDDESYTGISDPHRFLARLLAYLETPPHLRRDLFGLHPDLRTAGTLPSLDMPHHLKAGEWCRFREGVSFGPTGDGSSSVDVGFDARVDVPGDVPEYARTTVEFRETGDPSNPPRNFRAGGANVSGAKAVHPNAPRESAGYYWGYQVRSAGSLSAVFTESPFQGGYDLSWGMSERGRGLAQILREADEDVRNGGEGIRRFNHMLVVFGGVAGLEVATRVDPVLAQTEPKDLYEYWVNLVPGQGSRTIRTEEAIWLGLMGLQDVVKEKGIP